MLKREIRILNKKIKLEILYYVNRKNLRKLNESNFAEIADLKVPLIRYHCEPMSVNKRGQKLVVIFRFTFKSKAISLLVQCDESNTCHYALSDHQLRQLRN